MDFVTESTLKGKQAVWCRFKDLRNDSCSLFLIRQIVRVCFYAKILDNPYAIEVRRVNHERRMRRVD